MLGAMDQDARGDATPAISEMSFEDALRALDNETLVVHGREDRIIPLEEFFVESVMDI